MATDHAIVRIPLGLRRFTAGDRSVIVRGTTLPEILEDLLSQHPQLRSRLFDRDGNPARSATVFLNEADVRRFAPYPVLIRPCDIIRLGLPRRMALTANLVVLIAAAWLGVKLYDFEIDSPKIWASLTACTVSALIALELCRRVGTPVGRAAERFGSIAVGFIVFAALGTVLMRLIPSQVFGLVVGGLLAGVFVLAGYMWPVATEIEPTWAWPRLWAAGAVIGAVFVAFVIVTMTSLILESKSFGARTPAPAVLAQRRADRTDRLGKWTHGPVALTLSGGGYRAAVVHAGLLSVLDRAGIPVSYLSTVSGGSIFGGAYALGWTPENFADRLRSERPRLVDDFIQPWTPFSFQGDADLTGPAFIQHLKRVYFGDRVLQETGPPQLLINATEYLRGERATFWVGDSIKRLPPDELARLVAASAAFPGAFSAIPVGIFFYMDGGVFENLGLEGLRQYLDQSTAPTPRLLIICDVSKPLSRGAGGLAGLGPFSKAPSFVASAFRATEISYAARASDLLEIYRKEPERQYGSLRWLGLPAFPARRFWQKRGETRVHVAYLSPAALVTLDRDEAAAIDHVQGLDTLAELGRHDVDLAFWVGSKMAVEVLPHIYESLGMKPNPAIKLPPVPKQPPKDSIWRTIGTWLRIT